MEVIHKAKYRLKAVVVSLLIAVAIVAEVLPEETAKIVVVPVLVSALLAEGLIREW